jgi:NDP-sugar pyrophosphorylase family protein
MAKLADTVAVVLAGGMGTRLRGVVGDRPKVLAEVGGRPFLARLLDQLAGAGIGEAVLCTGYLADQVEQTFGDAHGALHLVYCRELSPLGTGGALRAAAPCLRSDPVLVMNGDSFCEADLPALWDRHRATAAEATLVLTRVADTRRYGRVAIDAGGAVVAFEEKGGPGGPGWVNAGICLLSRRVILSIPPSRPVSLEREVFPAWIGRGFYGLPCQGRFLDIGTPETYAAAERFFAEARE